MRNLHSELLADTRRSIDKGREIDVDGVDGGRRERNRR
jgi:hypothetical protein